MSPSPLCGGIVVFQFYSHKNQCKIAWARVGGVLDVSGFPLGCSGWLPDVQRGVLWVFSAARYCVFFWGFMNVFSVGILAQDIGAGFRSCQSIRFKVPLWLCAVSPRRSSSDSGQLRGVWMFKMPRMPSASTGMVTSCSTSACMSVWRSFALPLTARRV